MRLSTRLAIAMVMLVLVTSVVLGAITFQNIAGLGVPRALERLETHALLAATRLEASLSKAREDILSLRASDALRELIAAELSEDAAGELLAAEWRRRFAVRFAGELAAKPHYSHIRIIGIADGGREIVRVDRHGSDGSTRVAPRDRLEQTAGRDYFRGAIALRPGEVYVSPVRRNQGDADDQLAPVLRLASPLFAADGAIFGVAVITVDLRMQFERIRSSGATARFVYVINADGDYLLNPDPAKEFAFEVGAPIRIQDDFPGFFVGTGAEGELHGIFKNAQNSLFGLGWASAKVAGGAGLTVVQATSYGTLNLGLSAIAQSTLVGGGGAMLLAVLVALVLARSLSTPLVRMTRAVEGLSSGQRVSLPDAGNLELDVLASAFRRMAAEVKDKETRLRLTIQSISDALLVTDGSGSIVLANPAARRLFGMTVGKCGVQRATKFTLYYPDGVTPLAFEDTAIARALDGVDVDDFHLIVRATGSDDTFVVANARPLKDDNGKIQGAVAAYHDVTVSLKAQEALAASEQMARAIINSALDAFIQLDHSGVILVWSPTAEAMFGWTEREVIGSNVINLIVPAANHRDYSERLQQFLREIDGGLSGRRYEAPSLRRDGSEILTEVSITALRRGDKRIINAFLRDVTQKRIDEQRLSQAQKMESVGQLTGGIAHDFNNMLTVITGTVDILALGVADRPSLAKIVTLIESAANRGAELTANLLAFARKQPLLPCDTNVNGLLNETTQLLHSTLGEQVEVSVSCDQDLRLAMVDPNQLSSALVNLAINARDAMPEGGELSFETRNVSFRGRRDEEAESDDINSDYIMISIRDTGTGMSPAVSSRIFEPFFSTKGPGKGTGLGLSMVYGFVEQSGGYIEVESEEGYGTVFRLFLPATTGSVQTLEIAEEESSLPTGTETILCVEDNDQVREYVVDQLERLGYATLSATNAAEALAMAERGQRFDLLFTDIIMPGQMNGRQLADRLVALRPTLNVLFTTGFADNILSLPNQMDRGALLLRKPYRIKDLARAVRTTLDHSKGQRRDSRASVRLRGAAEG